MKLKYNAANWFTTIFLASIAQGCESSYFFSGGSESLALTAPLDPTPSPSPSATPDSSTVAVHTLRTLKPALAVRGMACLLCHANVRANVITDFGYGQTWFLKAGAGTTASDFTNTQSWYGDLADTWQTATIQGSLYVPKAQVPAEVLATIGVTPSGAGIVSIPGPKSLAELLVTPFSIKDNFGYTDATQRNSSMSYGVTPAEGAPAVQSFDQVAIRTFEDSDILALAPDLAASTAAAAISVLTIPGVEHATMSGLKLSGASAAKRYVTNDPLQTLVCSGADIVIKGTLFLNNARIDASNGGCRFYVAGSVFITGPIQYVGTTPTQNLQITSSRAISMGVGFGYTTANPVQYNNLQNRLLNDNRGAQISGTSFATRASQVLADALEIGFLQDAEDMKDVTYSSNPHRATIDFTGVLLNAPIIYSRYLGKIKGTLISDIALFALGAFYFEYDDVFEQVPVLPALPRSPLEVN